MANVRDLKKDINYVLGDIIEAVYIWELTNPDKENKKSEAIIDEAITTFDDLITKVNQKDVENKKKHFKSVNTELEDRGIRFLGYVNPYLAVAALVAAGLHGLENELPLEPALEGNAYTSDKPRVPLTLRHARETFAASDVAREAFGDGAIIMRPTYIVGPGDTTSEAAVARAQLETRAAASVAQARQLPLRTIE